MKKPKVKQQKRLSVKMTDGVIIEKWAILTPQNEEYFKIIEHLPGKKKVTFIKKPLPTQVLNQQKHLKY